MFILKSEILLGKAFLMKREAFLTRIIHEYNKKQYVSDCK